MQVHVVAVVGVVFMCLTTSAAMPALSELLPSRKSEKTTRGNVSFEMFGDLKKQKSETAKLSRQPYVYHRKDISEADVPFIASSNRDRLSYSKNIDRNNTKVIEEYLKRYPRQAEPSSSTSTFSPQNDQQIYPKYVPMTTTTVTPTPLLDIPDMCDTSYDAISMIREELFIFKNRYYWRIGTNGRYSEYPSKIIKIWLDLPNNLTHVDAVYERLDRKIAIFIGTQMYLFESLYLLPGYPKNLVQLGLPENLEKVDAAMVWGMNHKTYFFSGNVYWRFDEEIDHVELDYPRDMSVWQGVGYNIDSVFRWKDGKTYFFKGKGFWKFDDVHMRVENEAQLPSAQFWMGCPSKRTVHTTQGPKSYLIKVSLQNVCVEPTELLNCQDRCCSIKQTFMAYGNR